MQQLGEHGVTGGLAGVLGLKPNFIGLDVDQPFGVPLEAQGFDVSVFDVFFGFGGLELGVKAHEGQCKQRINATGRAAAGQSLWG